jgi:hypothetical protein
MIFEITGSAPSTATTAVVGTAVAGLVKYSRFRVTAQFAGNTGGALNVYLQRYDGGRDIWIDWVSFPQKAAAAASNIQTLDAGQDVNDIFVVGSGTSPTLTADSFTGGHPGNSVRCIAVSGASTSAGATVNISIEALH